MLSKWSKAFGASLLQHPKLGIFGANGIVAAGLPIAVGAAAASQLRADSGVAVSFFGDGAVAQGAFHEAVKKKFLHSVLQIFIEVDKNVPAQHHVYFREHAVGHQIVIGPYNIFFEILIDNNIIIFFIATL